MQKSAKLGDANSLPSLPQSTERGEDDRLDSGKGSRGKSKSKE